METPSNNLYMTNLPINVTDALLIEVFSVFGSVTSCRVLPNPTAGGSGAALVRFATMEEAQSVLLQVNGTTPPGLEQPVNIKFAVNKAGGGGGGGYGKWQDKCDAGAASSPLSGVGACGFGSGGMGGEVPGDNLYMKGLPDGTDEAWLTEALSGLGQVTSVRILPNPTQDGSCAALARFGSVEDATRVKELLHGQSPEWCPTQLIVRYATQKGGGGGGAGSGMGGMGMGAWQGNGSWPSGGDSSADAGLTVPEGRVDATSLVKMVSDAEVLPGSGTRFHAPESSVYVAGLPGNTTSKHAYQLFAPFGAITSVCVKHGDATRSGTGRPWAIAFVNYVDPLSAQAAIAVYNGMQIPDGTVMKVQLKQGRDKFQN